MERGRNLLVVQRHGCLDQACHTGRRNGVTDVRLHATDRTELFLVGLSLKHRPQRGYFNRIADRSRRTMCFDVADVFRIHAAHRMSHRDCVGLPFDAGCAEAGFVAAIVVDSKTTDDRVDSIVVGDGILKSLDHDHTGSIAEQRSGSVGVERSTVTIGRENATRLVKVTLILRESDRRSASQSHIAVPDVERLAGLNQRDQRGRARGVHVDRRTGKVQRMSNSGGDVILFIHRSHLKFACLANEFRIGQQIFGVVSSRVTSGPDSDGLI